MRDNSITYFNRRDVSIILATFIVAAFFFVGASSWATTIGTNIDSTGTLGVATSTPWGTLAVDQTATQGPLDPTFVVGDAGTTTPFIFVSAKGIIGFGSSTPSPLFLNPGDVVIGDNGSTNDLYVSGGLGVGNATTADSDFIVGDYEFTVFNDNIGMFGTTTPIISNGLSIGGNGVTADVYVSGGLGVGNATTTDGNLQVNGRTITTTLSVGTGTGNVLDRVVHGTCTVDPPSLSAGDAGHASCTNASGVTASDRVIVGVEGGAGWLADVVIVSASSTDTDTINFVFKNTSTTTVRDIGSGVHIYYFGTQ